MTRWSGRRIPVLRALTIAAYGERCWLCGSPILGEPVTVDHVLPRSRGGTDDLDNLRPAHRACNLARGNRPARPAAAARRPW